MQKLKKRKYNVRHISLTVSYSVQEIAEMYGLHKGSILNWVKIGLKVIDQQKPYLIHGSDLAEFLRALQVKRKHQCRTDEFYCCKCRQPRHSLENQVEIIRINSCQLNIRGICSVCLTPVYRAGSFKKIGEIQKNFTVKTRDEEHIYESRASCVNIDILKESKI